MSQAQANEYGVVENLSPLCRPPSVCSSAKASGTSLTLADSRKAYLLRSRVTSRIYGNNGVREEITDSITVPPFHGASALSLPNREDRPPARSIPVIPREVILIPLPTLSAPRYIPPNPLC